MPRNIRGATSAATVLAASLVLSLGGCAQLEEFVGGESGAQDASGAVVPGDTTRTAALSVSAPVTIDQTTPEAAMETWLEAMIAGDQKAVCTVMASDGVPVATIPGAVETCAKTVADKLGSVAALSDLLGDPSIKGATVVKDTATFEGVTTEPEEAGQIIAPFRAIKVGEAWYVCT